jgi:hypothetical protein
VSDRGEAGSPDGGRDGIVVSRWSTSYLGGRMRKADQSACSRKISRSEWYEATVRSSGSHFSGLYTVVTFI